MGGGLSLLTLLLAVNLNCVRQANMVQKILADMLFELVFTGIGLITCLRQTLVANNVILKVTCLIVLRCGELTVPQICTLL